jgi:predicted nucleotidyltransferase
MREPEVLQQTDQLLALLQDAGVSFLIIGGVAAIMHGAATSTMDLDVAAPLTLENVERLMTALRPYHPKHVTRPDLGEITDSFARLCEYRMLLIDTDLGRLDVLREVQPLGPAETLHSVEMESDDGRRYRVLDLDQLIEVKAFVGRPKDRIMERELRALRQRRGSAV